MDDGELCIPGMIEPIHSTCIETKTKRSEQGPERDVPSPNFGTGGWNLIVRENGSDLGSE